MTQQFEKTPLHSWGAPMGRINEGRLSDVPRGSKAIDVFMIKQDRGGYDDGGHYWGGGMVYCARSNRHGYADYINADNRLDAMLSLGLYADQIKSVPHKRVKEILVMSKHHPDGLKPLIDTMRALGYIPGESAVSMPCIVKTEPSGGLILVLPGSTSRGMLTCYTDKEGHSMMHLDYYKKVLRPVPPSRMREARELLGRYVQIGGENTRMRVLQRLSSKFFSKERK